MSRAIVLEKLIRITHLSYRIETHNRQRARSAASSGGIFLGWHCFIWILAHHFSRLGQYSGERFVTLASLSEDGQLITDVLQRLEWQVVRGSSSRGGIKSLRLLLRELEKENRVVLTPDGPRGPARQIKPGAVLLQRRSELPLIPVGVAVGWKYEFSSWDRFQLPLPGSKIHLHYGEPVVDLSGYDRDEACAHLEEKLEEACARAREHLH